MTDLREFAKCSVACDPTTPTRPSANIRVSVHRKAEINLALEWHDGEAIAVWTIAGAARESAGGRGSGFISLMFGSDTTPGEEWKYEQPKSAKQEEEMVHPRPTAVLARLLPLAMAWEAQPVRSADRLARAIALTLAGQEVAA